MDVASLKSSDYMPYYKRYIELVGTISLPDALETGMEQTQLFFENLPDETWCHRYAEGKWTPKDILQHIADTERVFAYRALYFARAKDADLKGFDENLFAENALANTKSKEVLLQDYKSVRSATLSLFKSFGTQQLKRTGIGNGGQMSVAAAGFIICGHEIHHRNIIVERYL